MSWYCLYLYSSSLSHHLVQLRSILFNVNHQLLALLLFCHMCYFLINALHNTVYQYRIYRSVLHKIFQLGLLFNKNSDIEFAINFGYLHRWEATDEPCLQQRPPCLPKVCWFYMGGRHMQLQD